LDYSYSNNSLTTDIKVNQIYLRLKEKTNLREKKYALKKGVDDSKWNMVTGEKSTIYYIARKSYLAVKTGKPSELYDMVHTENFVLIDAQKRVRGFYDGTKKEDIERLIDDINWLSQNE
jgi:protein SCO1/2